MAEQSGKTFFYSNATIPDGDDESETIFMKGFTLVALQAPASVGSATISFKAGVASDDTQPVIDTSGSLVTVTLDDPTNGVYTLNANDFVGLQYVSLVADDGNETGAKLFKLIGYKV